MRDAETSQDGLVTLAEIMARRNPEMGSGIRCLKAAPPSSGCGPRAFCHSTGEPQPRPVRGFMPLCTPVTLPRERLLGTASGTAALPSVTSSGCASWTSSPERLKQFSARFPHKTQAPPDHDGRLAGALGGTVREDS